MIILDRLKKTWECNDLGEGNCSCRCCGGSNCSCQSEENKNEKFVLKENLSDEEIEEIIETEYKDKNGYEKKQIKRALRIFGNKYSYHKTEFSTRFKSTKEERAQLDRDIIVTCQKHGDFTIKRSKFFEIGCPKLFVSDDKKFDEKFKNFKYKDLQGTREYLKNQIILGNTINKINVGIIVRDDFLKVAHKSRNDLDLFDFSEVQDVILGSSDKICIKYVSPKDGTVKDWRTDMNHFIDRKQIPTELQHMKLWEIRYAKNNFKESVIIKLEEKYPNLDFSNYEYKTMKTEVTVRCKIHNIDVTYNSVDHLLRDGALHVCPDCAREYRNSLEKNPYASNLKTTEEFIKECEEIYENGRFDYSLVNYKGAHNPVTIIDLKYNEPFEITPTYFLQGRGSLIDNMSLGESFVFHSLNKIKEENIFDMKIKREKVIKNLIEGRKTDCVKIDFICRVNSIDYWIEYNGEQHYKPVYYKNIKSEDEWKDAYKNQVKRDKNVKKYCSENNIPLIVIPYTYRNIECVYDILYNILVEGKSISDLIIFPEVEEV